MAKNGFLPTGDGPLLAWAQNFSEKISLAPTSYGLVAADATQFAAYLATYQTDLALVNDPATKTRTTVSQKNIGRSVLVQDARVLAGRIEHTPTVTDTQKISLGLTVKAHPAPIPPPADQPKLDVVSVNGRSVACRAHSSTDSKRGKPAGCAGLFIYTAVGPTQPASVSGWTLSGSSTKPTFVFTFPESVAGGSRVWITCAWFNPRTFTGPVADPQTVFLQGAATAAA